MANRSEHKRGHVITEHILGIFVFFAMAIPAALAQRATWQDDAFAYRGRVILPGDVANVEVAVCEFYTHGVLDADHRAVAVYQLGHQVPCRLLQVGPGDFCRVAFQVMGDKQDYQIYYGAAQPTRPVPPWTSTAGLRFEARQWAQCDLRKLESVRAAFTASKPIGSDYVDQVFQRFDPVGSKPEPFLSHYEGKLHVTKAGRYRFYTSSQDCSFLLIDSKLVVALPGRQTRLIGRARFKGEVSLTSGAHRFDYWHAASTTQTCAVAAWQPPGAPKLAIIPPTAFHADRVVHVPLVGDEQHGKGPLPNFRRVIAGDAPIAGSNQWAVRVLFSADSLRGHTSGRCLWKFGDGQQSTEWKATHVYLHPGLYDVTIEVRRRGSNYALVNRVWIGRPIQHRGKPATDKLDDYLPLIDTYNPATLDSASQVQLVRLRLQYKQWKQAVAAAQAALAPDRTERDTDDLWTIVQLVAPVARIRLAEPETALELWKAAGKCLQQGQRRAVCALQAADLLLTELNQPTAARPYLEFAQRRLGPTTGADAGMLYRLWGDYYARAGDAAKALAAYQTAGKKQTGPGDAIRRVAKRGALSRSTEAFLRDGDWVRAWDTLEQWQRTFPADKAEGYLSLLLARYWLARKQFSVAVVVADDLLTVNPRSPYADRLLMLQAEAEQQRGNRKSARAAYKSLLTDYPGSPLVKDARRRLAELDSKKP